MEKENATVDLANMGNGNVSIEKSKTKKTRSKSLGPGGLETALKENTGNRRKSIAVRAPRSILKAAIPLSPLKEIPSRRSPSSKGNDSPTRTPSRLPRASTGSSQEIGYHATPNTPTKSPGARRGSSPGKPPPSPRAHDRSHEEAEKRQKERAERRRTLAARRVSFAPEATLHTWDVVEYIQESTTSSASTNSSRRASAFAGSPRPNRRISSSSSGPPSTPPEQIEDVIVAESPMPQRDLHQTKRRRRSSTIPALGFNNADDVVSSSPCSGSSAAEDDTITSVNNISESGSDTENDDLIAELEGDDASENTATSILSNASGSSESARLDAALRQAVIQAHTTSLDYDDGGDASMEIAADEITAAFKPGTHRNGAESRQSQISMPLHNQQDADPFLQSQKSAEMSKFVSGQTQHLEEEEEDMSMEMTRSVGKILHGTQTNPKISRRSISRRQSVRARRRSSTEQSEMEDGTMDLTTAFGSIQPPGATNGNTTNTDKNEELSMEFTSVLGSIKPAQNSHPQPSSQLQQIDDIGTNAQTFSEQKPTSFNIIDDDNMEITTALGGIIQSEVLEEARTTQMDMTTALGRILHSNQESHDGTFQDRKSLPAQSPIRSTFASRARASVSTSETGSPAPANIRKAMGQRSDNTPSATPVKKPMTPSKQITPKPLRPTTPEKGTPSKNVMMRSASPKRLFQDEISAVRSPKTAPSPFRRGNPGVILAPPSSSNKINSVELSPAANTGSPRAAALLDRRASIGDVATSFSLQDNSHAVRFGDHQLMEAELRQEREEDLRRESRRFSIEQDIERPPDDVTSNLKDLIGSMTPKKNKSAVRKSLAVGGGKGLLGKRPRELDDLDGDEMSPERVKSRESPVKKIKLPAPPTKSQTIGSTRSVNPSSHSPVKYGTTTTPRHQAGLTDAAYLPSARKPLLNTEQVFHQEFQDEDFNGPIHLQDFLNMTNIRFMELNTTKRRHTVAPAPAASTETESYGQDTQLEAAIVAGSCVLPMLGLYQHSCRELKNYISAGRDIVREIEAYTFEENPPIFRDYLVASLEAKATMENQFKNLKSHARLLSKEMWYEWRMKLLEGINEDLLNVADGLQADDVVLQTQEEILNASVPGLVEEHIRLGQEYEVLQNRATELADCDQDDLKATRERLAKLNDEVEAKKQLLQLQQASIQEKENAIEDVTDAKTECTEAIIKAKRLREELRGWSYAEVESLKLQVEDLVECTGWRIVSASPLTLTMVYRGDIELFFKPMAWLEDQEERKEDTRISLSYISDATFSGELANRNDKGRPLNTEKRFFLQVMQAHLHGLPQETEVIEILQYVSSSWDAALDVTEEIRLLDRENVTVSHIVSDESLMVQSTLLIPSVKTKLHVKFLVRPLTEQNELRILVNPSIEAVYGEKYKEDRMRDYMRNKIENEVGVSKGLWADAVRELKARLITQGKKP